MAVGADGTHAAPVRCVDGALVLLVHRVAHLVAADAELERVRSLHGRVEPAPEDDPGDKASPGQGQQRVARAGTTEDLPETCETLDPAFRRVWHGALSLFLAAIDPKMDPPDFDLDQKVIDSAHIDS